MDETRQIIARDFDTMTKLLENIRVQVFPKPVCGLVQVSRDCPRLKI